MKVLINTPRLIPHGGVANHYIGLKEYWTETILYNPIGKKGNKSGTGKYRLPIDMVNFVSKIMTFNPDIILLNPSLLKSAVVRDQIFLRIAKLLKKKVAVFFHGFDINGKAHINISRLVNNLNKCECVFVLAEHFANILKEWGVVVPIYLTTTKVDDKLVESFNINEKTGKVKQLLFLARITETKGIFIALRAFKKLLNQHDDIHLTVVGDGPALNDAKRFCKEENINQVVFKGVLHGEDIIEEYKRSDLYLFPTYHSEGMPTSVLEAMAFGLPIISRPVGGLCDFFESPKMGELIDSLNPDDYLSAISSYIKDEDKTLETARYNHFYAKENFMASKVALSIEKILKQYI